MRAAWWTRTAVGNLPEPVLAMDAAFGTPGPGAFRESFFRHRNLKQQPMNEDARRRIRARP